MNHKDYWRERARILEEAQNRQGRECYAEVERQYREAQRVIEGKIASWYQRFADNNGITMQQARQMLKDKELEEFRWEVNDYIRHGKENARNGAWMEQLENASARAHITRLESLKLQIQQSLESMFGNQLDSVDSTIRNIYKDSYYKTAYEIQKGIGVGWDFASIDERKIEKVVKKPWVPDGRNFSERIWGNRQKLVNELHTELSRSIMIGEDPQKAINAIARKMKTSQNVAGRLVMTESAFFSSAAQKECYQELDVEQYEIVATLDSHTSELCREMDGKHFPMSQYEAGVTAPPFHVYCRSCTCPYFDDEFDRTGKRAARKADGKVYYVPGDMTYKEWQKAFVEGDKSGLQEVVLDDKISPMDITKEWIKNKGTKGSIVEKREYMVDGMNYKVDGRHVILRPTAQEKEIAVMLSEKYGKRVEFVPQVMYPQNIQTPDYLIDGERFDLKSPTGKGKNVLYDAIAKKRKQSPNFIFNLTGCPLNSIEVEKQINNIFYSRHTRFVEKIAVIKNGEIVKVYER